MSNPELATKVSISLERMDNELKERRAQEAKDTIRAERRAQAMAVVEAAYENIKSGIAGKGSVLSRATNRTNQTRSTDDTTLVDRTDPITRFKHAIDQQQASNLDVTEMGDLAERDPFYLLKSR